MNKINLRIGEKLKVQIMRLGINGEGIAYYKKRLIFVPYALTDEEVQIEITENRPNFSRAKVVNILKSSPYRVKPEDNNFASLSSSHIMHLAYPQQLEFKVDVLRQALNKYRPKDYDKYELRPTLGQANWHGYRNKLTYQLRRLNSGKTIAGLYAEGSHLLINLDFCLVQDKITQDIANHLCKLIDKYKIPVDDERRIKGIKTFVIRRSQLTGEVQIILISSNSQNYDRLIKELTENYPEIVTVASNLHEKKTSEVYGEKTEIIWGQEKITEGLLGYDFELSPRAFFQLNTKQAEVLYHEVIKAVNANKEDRVLDAYCGSGTIGFALAKKVKSVHGMDIVPESVEDARANAARLGFKNCHYETGRAEKVIANMYKSNQRPTAVIVDPPRTGLDEQLIETLVKFQPEKLVYVSCNVSTLAKDLVALSEIYDVNYIQSVDMFPQTARCEAVVKMTKKKI
ncbi:23S rRNA (uracil(1939)-C(5))-methyltransferase RlmD [Lactovum miscens]|uniref:23S rRNA (Uracil-5-)-methyltransferase RumA n=1 Tax=Lactovum miscens TaxID=190387 RepID=A0A841CBG3_9LACT|nr:23S rRNA (uracil(1939)-C(5))-methyltransferase RlmD [Lactovum miscens]MBB5888729.1 23S rRNA (uracil-5-)-methyltransferase RumA [Lactovum miscens]